MRVVVPQLFGDSRKIDKKLKATAVLVPFRPEVDFAPIGFQDLSDNEKAESVSLAFWLIRDKNIEKHLFHRRSNARTSIGKC